MLIDIFMKSSKGGYLGKEMPGSLSFFPNNTLCLRRTILKDIGVYDERCINAEDVDICARIARSRWLMFLCRSMILHHRSRPNLAALLRQWWGYGKYIPYVFKKYNAGQWEVFFSEAGIREGPRSPSTQYRRLLYWERMPITVCIFISPFLILHLLLIASLLDALLGFNRTLLLCTMGTVVSLVWYLRPDFVAPGSLRSSVMLAVVRYCVNLAFVGSHLLHGWRYGTFYCAQAIAERVLPK